MCVPLELQSVVWLHNEYSQAPSLKYPKEQLSHLASGVFVAINKSYFSVYTHLKEMTLQLASVVCRGGFGLLVRNVVFRVIRDTQPKLASLKSVRIAMLDQTLCLLLTLRDILWLIIITFLDKLRRLENIPLEFQGVGGLRSKIWVPIEESINQVVSQPLILSVVERTQP